MAKSFSDGNSDELPSAETQGAQARKARKRATDRVAQREHRRRQKVYVEELEAQVRVLKQQSVADQIGVLLLENEGLRTELKELKAFCSAIESLVNGRSKVHAEPEFNGPVSEKQNGATESANFHSPLVSQVSLGGLNDKDAPDTHSIAISDPMTDNMTRLTHDCMAPDAQHQHDDTTTQQQVSCQDTSTSLLFQQAGPTESSFDAVRDWWGISLHEAHDLGHSSYSKMDTPMWLNNFFAVGSLSPSSQFHDLGNPVSLSSTREQHNSDTHFSQHESSSDMDVNMINKNHVDASQWELTELPEQHFQIQEPSPKDISSLRSADRNSAGGSPNSTRTKFEVQIHRSLPHVLMPPLPQDVYVHEIIERARSNTVSRRMLLDAPTLANFLVDNSANVLSNDLKKYLEPVRRSRRTAEYLGTYWVSYLLLRWQVNQSEESFARVPRWFRPTDLQMHAPHPIAIDFVAWPRLRDELVRLSQSEPEKVHEVMTTIGVYLELNLETSMAQSLTNEEVLNSAVCDLRNWKLRDGFYEIYPQWKGVCEPVDVEDFDDL
ncbi:hypothetical protein ACEPPN_014809 [Leptodophora sp. 'Broadleaf-Isolate-01']